MSLLLEASWTSPTPMQTKRAAVMMGRMNPPTAGHLAVIRRMIQFCKEESLKPIVILVHGEKSSQDLRKNPLSAEERLKYLKAAIGDSSVLIFESNTGGPGAFEQVRERGYEPIAVAAGSDRAAEYKKTLDLMFLNDGEPIQHVIVPGLKERDPTEDGESSEDRLRALEKGGSVQLSEVSGTMARLAVKLGLRKAFSKILGVSQNLSDTVFDEIAASQKRVDDEETVAAEAKKAAKAAKEAAKEAAKKAAKEAKKTRSAKKVT